VKFGLKIPNRLGNMPENLGGDFLTHTVHWCVAKCKLSSPVKDWSAEGPKSPHTVND